jgi:hypothetical protein
LTNSTRAANNDKGFLHGGSRGIAKSASRNGYCTWARCGFDAPLRLDEQRRLLPELRGARTLSELFAPGGMAWRKTFGNSRPMVFDLAPNSSMMNTRTAYLQELKAKGWQL